jgi:hypothetical protein
LTEYYELGVKEGMALDELETDSRLAFDEKRDQYLWFRSGWEEKKLIYYITMYLRIKDGQIWVEEDWTDFCVVDDLLAAGIPKRDIVLEFHNPYKRKFMEFAVG